MTIDDGTAELMELNKAMPLGYKVASNRPSLEQLTFRNEHAGELLDKLILFNWCAIGWTLGKITSINKDARKKVKGAHVNFNVYYEIDENTSNHNLMLDNYGDLGLAEDGQWLLLAKSGGCGRLAKSGRNLGEWGGGPTAFSCVRFSYFFRVSCGSQMVGRFS